MGNGCEICAFFFSAMANDLINALPTLVYYVNLVVSKIAAMDPLIYGKRITVLT